MALDRTSYAESHDGLSWVLPKLGLVEWKGTNQDNVAWRGIAPKWYVAPFELLEKGIEP